MNLNRFSLEWKRIQDAVTDVAKLGSREIKRGITETKKKIEKKQLVQCRKDLFAELGRTLYEAYEDGLPKDVEKFLNETELHEILSDIKMVDKQLLDLKSE